MIFIDETWAKTNMTRLRGRAPRGGIGGAAGKTFVLGGDGRYFNDRAAQVILRMAAASGAKKIIVGQTEVIEQLFAAIFTRGHCLLEGVPGLAKTLMVRTLAEAIHMGFRRIQFTPDLLPADLINRPTPRMLDALETACDRMAMHRSRYEAAA